MGSLMDLWAIIVLIIPGFITFRLISWFASFKNKFDQFTTVIYSLICSLIVFLPIAAIYEIESLQHARQVVGFTIFSQLVMFSLLFGFLPGLVLKYTIRKSYHRASAWNEFAYDTASRKNKHHFVTIYTHDDKEYVGWIRRMSIGDEKQELVLREPQFVRRLGEKEELKDMGYEMLFPEGSIKRILRM